MKKPERLFCCTTYTTNKNKRIFSALTGIGNKYITYTISIPPKPKDKKSLKSGIAGTAGTGPKPWPTPAVSLAGRGFRAGGIGGTAKIEFFLFFYFRRRFPLPIPCLAIEHGAREATF